jgi:hypothetical protein
MLSELSARAQFKCNQRSFKTVGFSGARVGLSGRRINPAVKTLDTVGVWGFKSSRALPYPSP